MQKRKREESLRALLAQHLSLEKTLAMAVKRSALSGECWWPRPVRSKAFLDDLDSVEFSFNYDLELPLDQLKRMDSRKKNSSQCLLPINCSLFDVSFSSVLIS
jgi:hypothetical protein